MTEIQYERRPGEWMRRSILNNRKTEIKCIKKKNCVTISRMDAFLAPLSLIFSHSATALLLQIINRLVQKSIHSGFTFVIKQPLKRQAQPV